MARKTRRESNVGLVVTLIFFILLAIGLGVSTYYGFAGQKDATDKATASDNAAKAALAKADWNQFQALTYRNYLGQTEGLDAPADAKGGGNTLAATLGVLRGKYDTNQLGQEAPDKASVVKLIQAVESSKYKIAREDKNKQLTPQSVTMAWNKETMRPNTNYDEVYKGQQALIDYYEQQTAAAVRAKEEAETARKKSDDDLAAARKAFADETKKLSDQNNADLAQVRKDNSDQRDQLKTANDEKNAAIQKGEDAVNAVKKDLKDREDKVAELQKHINDMNERIALQEQKTQETPSAGKPITTDWKITRMDSSGKQPFINMGSAQGVKPGLTFSIHGQGPDGKPMPQSKGTLEVLNVVNDSTSQAQVVSVKDAFKDPILPGDYLYNPIFKPGAQQHVAIAGKIRMHGPKSDDLDEFERLLKRQNVVVDGYVDPQDGTIKGRLTVGTDYLVLGDIADVKEGTPEAASIKQLQEQARNNGVHIVSAREFLESMGQHTP